MAENNIANIKIGVTIDNAMNAIENQEGNERLKKISPKNHDSDRDFVSSKIRKQIY